MLKDLMNEKRDSGQLLHADSAYRSEEIEKMLSKRNVESQIHEKGYRNHLSTKRQKERNRKKS